MIYSIKIKNIVNSIAPRRRPTGAVRRRAIEAAILQGKEGGLEGVNLLNNIIIFLVNFSLSPPLYIERLRQQGARITIFLIFIVKKH